MLSGEAPLMRPFPRLNPLISHAGRAAASGFPRAPLLRVQTHDVQLLSSPTAAPQLARDPREQLEEPLSRADTPDSPLSDRGSGNQLPGARLTPYRPRRRHCTEIRFSNPYPEPKEPITWCSRLIVKAFLKRVLDSTRNSSAIVTTSNLKQ